MRVPRLANSVLNNDKLIRVPYNDGADRPSLEVSILMAEKNE